MTDRLPVVGGCCRIAGCNLHANSFQMLLQTPPLFKRGVQQLAQTTRNSATRASPLLGWWVMEGVMVFVDPIREQAVQAVRDERVRQEARWGEQNHEMEVWLSILTEEVGELARAMNERRFTAAGDAAIRIEAVQVAAVAVQIVEFVDRQALPF